jgi:hypothetical protein
MKSIERTVIFFIFILSFVYPVYNLKCDDSSTTAPTTPKQVDSAKEQGGGFYASSPECSAGLSEAIVGIGTLYIAGTKFIIPGIIDLATGASGVKKAIAIARITTGGTLIATIATSISTSLQCFFSFVRDPIVFKDDDPNKDMLDDKNNPTNNRWEAASTPYSKNITVCARNGMTSYIAYRFFSNKVFSCYGSATTFGNDNTFYDGAKALLCPEEWRFHGYKAETRIDTTDNKQEQYAIKGNGLDNDFNSNTNVDKFFDARHYSGPLECKKGQVGSTLYINSYKYSIIKVGAKICARLDGLGDLPSITGSFMIGCHYTTPDDPAPLCDKSEKIFLKNSDGSQYIDKITQKPVLIDYDNSACFSCYVGETCFSRSAGHALSAMPITSYIMECMQSTIYNVMFGCKKIGTEDKPVDSGLLYLANQSLMKITYLAITLFVILLGYRILTSNNLPKFSELMVDILKVAVILFVIHGDGEDNGIQWVYNRVQSLSSGISSIIIRASSNINGLCAYTDEMYKYSSNGIARDFSFIKPYDVLDCFLFFYIGGALYGYSQKDIVSWSTALSAVPRLLIIIFPLIMLMDPMALLIGIFFLLFALLIISISVWFLSLVVLSMIMLFILIIIAPIVLPMMLFKYTKTFFDNWVKELMAYTLFQPFMFMFLGIMLATFNSKLFGATVFEPIDLDFLGRKVKHFVFRDIVGGCGSVPGTAPDWMKKVCKSCDEFMVSPANCDGCDPAALACMFKDIQLWKGTTSWGQGNIKPDKSMKYFLNILQSIGYVLLMAFIYLTLVTTVAFLVAKVVGGSRSLYAIIGNAVSPIATFIKSAKLVSKPGRKLTGKAFGSASSAVKSAVKSDPKASASTRND